MVRLLQQFDDFAARHFPPQMYFTLQDWLRPNSHNKLARGGRRATSLDAGFRVQWDDGAEFFFAHPQRYVRYMRPNGVEYIFDRMRRKYQDGAVSVAVGDVVVDVGANVGEFTCAVAPLASRILAFEPDPHVLPSLDRNVASSRNVKVLPFAAGSSDGHLEFFLQTATADSSLIQPEQWSSKITVPTKKLSTAMNEAGVECIDFLKVEAEGYEPEVLEGARDVLGVTRKVAVDCSPERQGQSTFEDCENILISSGFKTWRRTSGHHVLFAVNKMLAGIQPLTENVHAH